MPASWLIKEMKHLVGLTRSGSPKVSWNSENDSVSYVRTPPSSYNTRKRSYSPANKLPPKKADSCHLGEFKRGREIGRGSYGTVYAACLANKDCKYVVKTVDLYPEDVEQFWMEVLINRRAGEAGYGPKIYRAFTCYQRGTLWGIIIMQRLGKSLDRYNVMSLPKSTLDKVFHTVQAMHADGVFHQDLYTRNVAYSMDKRKIYVLDFGAAFLYEKGKLPKNKAAADWAGLIYGQPMKGKGGFCCHLPRERLRQRVSILFSRATWTRGLRSKVDADYDPRKGFGGRHGRGSGYMNCKLLYSGLPAMPKKLKERKKMWIRYCKK